jgi:hypothetical protein
MAKISFSNKKIDTDTLRINLAKGKIKFHGNVLKYRDRDTRQIVIFIPSLDITGYGATEKKAQEMIHFLLGDFFAWLVKLPHSRIDTELRELGWKHLKYKNKEYSQAFIDGDGRLQNFNAVGDEVERLTVLA